LLLAHLATEAASKEPVQVIASSHSPILASQAPIDSIVAIHESSGKVTSVSICSLQLSSDPKEAETLKKKLQRFLDATRAELFFARRVLMVEGIAEALLVPVFAKLCGGSLKKSAVTVVNVDGLNFNAFLPLFGKDKLSLPVVILTDGDAPAIGAQASSTAKDLKAQEAGNTNLRVELSERTLEHELARSSALLPIMLDAFAVLHPTTAKTLRNAIVALQKADEKADAFYLQFIESKTSKGSFAQELALLLESSSIAPESIPEYIRRAFQFLGVIQVGGSGGPATTSGAAPVPTPKSN
jgi:putative ATP-dependent endonuclease of OLD family